MMVDPCDLCREAYPDFPECCDPVEHTGDAVALARVLAREVIIQSTSFKPTPSSEFEHSFLEDAGVILYVLAEEGYTVKPTGGHKWDVDQLGSFGPWEPLFMVNGHRFGINQDVDTGCSGEIVPAERVTNAMLAEVIDEGYMIGNIVMPLKDLQEP